MKRIFAAAGLLAALMASPVLAQTEVSELEVRGEDNVLLRVTVSGDMGPRTVVVSNSQAGINCGLGQYKYTEHENRQCWLWVRRNKAVVLGAKGMQGQFGQDWSVAWSGCEALEGGKACRIAPGDETTVGAVFTGRPQ